MKLIVAKSLDLRTIVSTIGLFVAIVTAISIPAGLSAPEGGGPELPVGFQIASPAFTESKLLDAAHALERAIGFEGRPAGAE